MGAYEIIHIEPDPAGEPPSKTHPPSGPRRMATRTRVLLIAVGAAVVLTLAATFALQQGDPVNSFDSWTPRPAPLEGDRLTRARGACPEAGSPAMDEVLTEARGVTTLLLRANRHQAATCLSSDDETLAEASAPLLEVTPEPSDVTVIWYLATSSAGKGRATLAYGSTGNQVEAVTITRADHTDVQATVSDGWWAAWWPGEYDPSATLTIHTSDGTTSTAGLEESFVKHQRGQ